MASISGNNKIVLKGDFGMHEEGFLKAAVSPGMNVVLAGDPATQQRDGYAPGTTDHVGTGTGITTTKAPIKLVKEKTTEGKGIEDAYAITDNVLLFLPVPGNVVQVLAKSGETIVKAGGLSADSTGKWVADTTNAAVEALEGSVGALGADTHVRVRVL